MRKLPKIVQLGIEYHLPMWWEPRAYYGTRGDGLLELRVQTGDTLIGKMISRAAMQRGFGDALKISLELLQAGAKLDVYHLVRWTDNFDPWRYGWDAKYASLRESVWQASGKIIPATDWDGWHIYKRTLRAANDEQ